MDKMLEAMGESLNQFDEYRSYYAGSRSSVEEVLKEWVANKSDLFHNVMGEQLILKKHICYERSESEICNEVEALRDQHSYFMSRFMDALYSECRVNYSDFYYTIVESFHDLSCSPAVAQDAEAMIRGHRMQIHRGQKLMKAIGKLSKYFNLSDAFEKFRIAYSQIGTAMKVEGDMCLSIHPLDFATASDNENDWHSCMSWRNEGEYRLGTIEMMTSPYVICAYIASDSAMMDIGNLPWNSKKWRAWIIVTPDFIVSNRNYPYDNEQLSNIAVDWVKSLIPDIQYEDNVNNWESGDIFSIDMNYMYNDMYEGRVGCYAVNRPKHRHHHINVSGPAVCMDCGAIIPYDSDYPTDTLCCGKCSGFFTCSACGCWVNENSIYMDEHGEGYCEDCYYEATSECQMCQDRFLDENTRVIQMPIDFSNDDACSIRLCEGCFQKFFDSGFVVQTSFDEDVYYFNPFSGHMTDELKDLLARENYRNESWHRNPSRYSLDAIGLIHYLIDLAQGRTCEHRQQAIRICEQSKEWIAKTWGHQF